MDSVIKIVLKTFLYFHPNFQSFVTVSNIGQSGRLGNQLFQYATAKSYSKKNKVKLLLPNGKFNRISQFRLNCIYTNKYVLDTIEKVEYYEQKWFCFNKNIFKKYKKYNLNGFFQNEKYFKDIRSDLLTEIVPKDKNITNYCKNYISQIKKICGKHIVALHCRRGDFIPTDQKPYDHRAGVSRPDMDLYHPLLDLEYFKKAKSHFKDSVFLVFSDTHKDIGWCKRNLKDENTFFSENHDDITDLILMSYCDHNIISNSSFSWWAAWLNQNKKKKVIAPDVWLGKSYSQHDTKDLIPKDWMILKN